MSCCAAIARSSCSTAGSTRRGRPMSTRNPCCDPGPSAHARIGRSCDDGANKTEEQDAMTEQKPTDPIEPTTPAEPVAPQPASADETFSWTSDTAAGKAPNENRHAEGA